jgi:hypothetical protein
MKRNTAITWLALLATLLVNMVTNISDGAEWLAGAVLASKALGYMPTSDVVNAWLKAHPDQAIDAFPAAIVALVVMWLLLRRIALTLWSTPRQEEHTTMRPLKLILAVIIALAIPVFACLMEYPF